MTKTSFKMRETAVALATLAATLPAFSPLMAQAADKAATKAAGTYVTGDFHNHTTCSDGTLSMKKLIDKSAGTFNLDWFVQADHGGSSTRNCTLAEDPFQPVAPALGIPSGSTIPSGGQPATDLKGPNQTWQATLPNGAADIKGNSTSSPKAMFRWQEISEFQYPITEAESRSRKKPIWIGVEQNAPGHEHISTTVLNGQLPFPSAATGGNANLQAQYEYCFDRSDTDNSRGNDSTGAGNNWDCSVTGSANNSLIDATARKITGTNSSTTANLGHLKTLEGIKWMNEKAPSTSYFVPAHLERAGAYNPLTNAGFNIEHLRNFNNAAPRIAFGFESMPGHQAEAGRGSYGTGAVGGGTYGGTGVYAAQVGGVWDALLGEGRGWWFFGSSDYHNRGSFGPDQRETTADFFPGEYTRDFVMVRKGAGDLTAGGIIDGLRSGNSFVANGQLIDRLSFTVCAANPGLPRNAGHALMQKAGSNAVAANGDVRINGCATMGEKLVVRPGTDLVVTVVLRDPVGTNNSPYSFPNPSLKQVNIDQPLNAPVLDHVDVINGLVTGYVDPSDGARYAGLLNSTAATNSSTKIAKVFNTKNWTKAADGTISMSYIVPAATASQYFRLRGSNLPASVPFETDANGNPLLDFGSNPADTTLPGKIACSDAACPAHMRTLGGVKYASYDVAGWADLWFYSNPVYIEVTNAVKVAGVK
ncbi:hypothetical protein GT347_18120 [Xylophilus rhododendri]|uniref:Uncharacterized protein n=1 Tax=Xylophilus rhododendri TaxID=2697032 RepID=A0A857J6U8_9BURK|nr:hypothetical protein [Xylophilus rhododendri]QHI99724.1 hypothetical protein GT347_18120 [Xylophilus rhododendri]